MRSFPNVRWIEQQITEGERNQIYTHMQSEEYSKFLPNPKSCGFIASMGS